MKHFFRLLLALTVLLATCRSLAGTVTYIYTDPQGTPLAEANSTGAITATFDYRPYGTPVASMSGSPNGPGFTGHVNDPDTGFVYMQARYYDPSVARFLSIDPVSPSATKILSFGRYSYGTNNPIRFVDRDGRQEYDPQTKQYVWRAPEFNYYRDTYSGRFIASFFNPIALLDENHANPITGRVLNGRELYEAKLSLLTLGAAEIGLGERTAGDTLKNVVDELRASGRTRGAAAEMVSEQGHVRYGVSSASSYLEDDLTAKLMSLKNGAGSPYFSYCAEIQCVNSFLRDGISTEGAEIRVMAIGESSPGHGLSKEPCVTCNSVLQAYGVTYHGN